MPPSATPPETAAAPACLAVLDGIERHWRDALSALHAADPLRAQKQVDAAGRILAQLGSLEELRQKTDPARLAELARRMAGLSALHQELTVQSRRAQEDVARALHATRQGRIALRAYGAATTAAQNCDTVG